MGIHIGANKLKDIYIGTNKVKEIYFETNKIFNTIPNSNPVGWTTLWNGNQQMHDDDDGDGTSLTINGLTDSKPIKARADCHVVAWVPTWHYGGREIIYDEVVYSLTIDTSSTDSNIPYDCDVSIPFMYGSDDISFYYDATVYLYVYGNTIYSDPAMAMFCGGTTCGMAYWVLNEVAQYEG